MSENLVIVVYVDNILILSLNLETIKKVKAYLIARYKMKNANKATKFVRISIYRDRVNRRIRLEQSSYTKKIVRN